MLVALRMAKNKWRYWLLGSFLFYACGNTSIYQAFTSLEHSQWPASSVLDFSFQVEDETRPYDIYLLVKNTQDYPYQNLYVTYYLEGAAHHLLREELKNYPLFDIKTGRPRGKGWIKSKRHEFLLINGYYFSQPGLYTLKLEHFMRTDYLPGLQTIGVKVIPSKSHPNEKER